MYYPLNRDFAMKGCAKAKLNNLKHDDRFKQLKMPVTLYDVQAYSGVNLRLQRQPLASKYFIPDVNYAT
jgi:hypothetical protein